MKADNFRIADELCRAKLRSIDPKYASNIPYAINSLKEKGVIMIGYDTTGKKYVEMSPMNELVSIMNNKDSKQKRNHFYFSKDDMTKIKDTIISIIKIKGQPTKQDIFDEISKSYPLMTDHYITRILYKMRNENLITIKLLGSRKNRTSVYVLFDHDKNDDSYSVKFTPQDIKLIMEAFYTFKISGFDDPREWIKNTVLEIAINLLNKNMLLTNITLDAEHWRKHEWLKEDIKEKDEYDVDKMILSTIYKFIDSEYEKRYIYNHVTDMITQSKDQNVLNEIRSVLNRKIQDLSTKD
jgi:hypothetical protein